MPLWALLKSNQLHGHISAWSHSLAWSDILPNTPTYEGLAFESIVYIAQPLPETVRRPLFHVPVKTGSFCCWTIPERV
jgi:hypothetical protein